MSAKAETTARIPVSMRLPAEIVGHVERFASETRMRKTDAYLHFIELGMRAEAERESVNRLATIEAQMAEITRLLKEQIPTVPNVVHGNTLELIFDAVRDAAASHKAISRVFLFGSFARGTASDGSDVDLRLELDRTEQFNLHDLEHFCKQVEQLTGREVDVVTATDIKNEKLAEAIEREKVLIYERQAN